ncbi:MAG: peptidoglycan binding domain-containing protein [Lachnospiraceae bacterium]|nr:peptidoglycan binding domain-containing protein [Lachnospiraceae bacterium]MBQ9608761.1 peptidoglycan binding domain-containing protein [Lachnospiraceae bacterium]
MDKLQEDIDMIPFVDPLVKEYKEKKKKRKKVLYGILGGVLGIYLAGVLYSSFFFLNNTKINGKDVSFRSISNAEKIIQADADSYTLDIVFRNGMETLTPKDINASVMLKEDIKSINRKQNAFIWPLYFFNDSEYTVDYQIKYDEEGILSYINTLSYMSAENMEKPENAYVEFADGETKIIPETDGTVLQSKSVVSAIEKALDNYDNEIDLDAKECYEKAKINSEDEKLAATLSNAETFLERKAQYNFGGYIYDIPKEELTKMAYINKFGRISIDKDEVMAYAQRFADEFTTYHKDREFITHDGHKILISGGYYGWEIDAEAEGEELYEALSSMEDFTKEPVCTITGYTFCDMNDIGSNYVEIDLTDQHVYVFKDGKNVYDSPCVSGNLSWGMSTPGGVYPITYTQRNATLRGPNYETKVAYWMPFNFDIGMHDATWKTKFGEDYYKYDGSHGCINLPLDAAAEIFELVEKGMPVVCYWEDEVTFLR